MTRIENRYPVLNLCLLGHTDNLFRLYHCKITQLADSGGHRRVKDGLGFTGDLNSPVPVLVRLPDFGRGGFRNFGGILEMTSGLLQAFLKRPAHQRHHPRLALRV